MVNLRLLAGDISEEVRVEANAGLVELENVSVVKSSTNGQFRKSRAIIGGIAGGGKGAAIGAGVGALGGFIGKKLLKFGVYLNRAISLPRY